jgi:putative endonuclease
MNKQGFVYILGNNNKTLYIGVTADLPKRIMIHKQKLTKGFTKKYFLHKLLYYEVFDTMQDAIIREKQLKRWHREWKLNLIKSMNPNLRDLYPTLRS